MSLCFLKENVAKVEYWEVWTNPDAGMFRGDGGGLRGKAEVEGDREAQTD